MSVGSHRGVYDVLGVAVCLKRMIIHCVHSLEFKRSWQVEDVMNAGGQGWTNKCNRCMQAFCLCEKKVGASWLVQDATQGGCFVVGARRLMTAFTKNVCARC